MSKRTRFLITSILLSLGFIGIQFLDNQYRIPAIGGLGAVTIGLFVWSLWEGLGRDMTLATLILPFFYTVGVGLFWFLLPVSIFTRIPIVLLYGIGIYSLCLTTNIYTVAAIRTIALLRAAKGVGFVITLFTFFLIFDAVLSLRTTLPITAGSIALISIPLFFQGLWFVQLEKEFDKKILTTSFVSALVVGQIAAALHFWPVTVVVGSLFLTIAVYVLLGLSQARVEARLFSQTVRDYLIVGIIVFIGMFFATSWGA